MQRLGREEDGAVEGVRKAAVAAADLHCDDDEFGKGLELAREGGVDAGVAEGEADGAVGGDDFEEDGEEGEGVFVGLWGVSWGAWMRICVCLRVCICLGEEAGRGVGSRVDGKKRWMGEGMALHV